jgi:amino acid transporter
MVAGAFGVLGALGSGVRATAIETAQDEPRQVGVLMGYRSATGWVLCVLALMLVLAAVAWLGRRRILKLGAGGVALAFVVLTVLRLSFFDRRAAEWADAARQQPDFAGYHAGLGWGAWLLLAAAIVAGFALIIGALRALDLRKGIPG